MTGSKAQSANDNLGAFCREHQVALTGRSDGALAGLTFAAKDVFDIRGVRTGFGQPDWLASHPAAEQTAPAVQQLLDSGADLVGKTVCDEVCFSLSGENVHYGTPLNPWDTRRIPGGSSSGSASATAAGVVDFALGTDCGGSVRVPASYCGLLGIRPTHGRITLDGVAPFAPSFDTIGWFAREADILLNVGRVLFGDAREPAAFKRVLIPRDAFDIVGRDILIGLTPALEKLKSHIGHAAEITLARQGLDTWFQTFRQIQGFEIWRSLSDWVHAVQPTFGPAIKERIDWASRVTPAQADSARAHREQIHAHLDMLIAPGDVVVLPTTPRPAPAKGGAEIALETTYRHQAMSLLCSAGLAGLPQINLPLGQVQGLPVGLSILAQRGCDIDLLGLASRLCTNAPEVPKPTR